MKSVTNPSAISAGKLRMAVLLCLASTGALAQDSGWYGGFNIGESRVKIDTGAVVNTLRQSGFDPQFVNHDDKDLAFKILGGYQLNQYLGLEASYYDLGEFGLRASILPVNAPLAGEIKARGFGLDLVATYPVTDAFSVFARAGAIHSRVKERYGYGPVRQGFNDSNDRDTDYKYGIGMQFALSEAVSLRAEAERYHLDDAFGIRPDATMYSVGLVFGLGSRPAPAPVAAAPAPRPQVAPPAPAPAPPPPPPQPVRVTLEADSVFGFDSAELSTSGRSELDGLIADLEEVDVQQVTVIGHTDRLGAQAYNQQLSERRAQVVRDYLIANSDVPANRITARGVNGSDPVTTPGQCVGQAATPALIACLQPDRRVEVEVTATSTP